MVVAMKKVLCPVCGQHYEVEGWDSRHDIREKCVVCGNEFSLLDGWMRNLHAGFVSKAPAFPPAVQSMGVSANRSLQTSHSHEKPIASNVHKASLEHVAEPINTMNAMMIYAVAVGIVAWFYLAFVPCVSEPVRHFFLAGGSRWIVRFVEKWFVWKIWLWVCAPLSALGFFCALCGCFTERNTCFGHLSNLTAGLLMPSLVVLGIPVALMACLFVLASLLGAVGLIYSIGTIWSLGYCLFFKQSIVYALTGILLACFTIMYFALPIVCWCR